MGALEVIFLTASILTLAAGLIILAINPWRMINRCYLVSATCSALWLFCVFMSMRMGYSAPGKNPEAILFWLRMSNAVGGFLPWAYFITKESTIQSTAAAHILKRSAPWMAVSCLLALLAFSEIFYVSSSYSSGFYRRGIGYPIHLGVLTVLCGLIFGEVLKVLRTAQGVSRIEIKFFAINFCTATLVILLLFFISSVWQIASLRYASPFVIVFSFGLTIWAVCYYRVFDARQTLLLAGQRVILLGLLGLGTVSLAALSEPFIPAPYRMFMAAVLACTLPVYLDRPTKKWFGLDSHPALLAARQTIISWARKETDEDKLRGHFSDFLTQWCQTDHARLSACQDGSVAGHGIILPSGWAGLDPVLKEGWITPEALHRQRKSPGTDACLEFLKQHKLGALLAVPSGSPTPSLLIALGQKQSQRPYTYPDIQQLLELAELMDNILTHSRAAARIAQIEKMEAAAMMSRGLAHDLNNLATPVASFLLHMEPRVAPDTPEADVLRDAKHSVRVMQDYIRESLFFTRRLVPDFRPVVARELLQSVVQLTQTRAHARGVAVVLGHVPDIHFVADGALIRRLLQNLVSNGIDATPRGGTVTLAGRPTGDSRVCFSITDEGPGVPPALKERIFDPYFTTKDTGDEVRGLGLGLAICRKICDLHHGEIEVGSAPDHGAVFTVELPVDPGPSSVLATAANPVPVS